MFPNYSVWTSWGCVSSLKLNYNYWCWMCWMFSAGSRSEHQLTMKPPLEIWAQTCRKFFGFFFFLCLFICTAQQFVCLPACLFASVCSNRCLPGSRNSLFGGALLLSAGGCWAEKQASAVTGRSRSKMFNPDGKTGKIKGWLTDRQTDVGQKWWWDTDQKIT